MNTKTNSHVGRKTLYALVIAMSGLILLLSVGGILGVWAVQQPLTDAGIRVMKVVETSAKVVRTAAGRVDETLAALQAKTTDIASASDQLSQNVTDKGLVLTLLPEEKEQGLIDAAGSVKDTYNGVKDTIANGLDLYRSIDRLPFLSLPGLNADQTGKIDGAVTQAQTLADTLRSQIADFRSGVAGPIDKVGATAVLLEKKIGEGRDALSQLQTKMAALQALSVHLQQVIPGVIMAIAVLITLILAFLIFTQVELIRLYASRWRLLGQLQVVSPTEGPAKSDQAKSDQ